MALAIGKSALEKLKTFRARGWYIKEFKKFAGRVSQEYSERSEVVKGVYMEEGSDATSGTSLYLKSSVGHVMLKGKLHPVAAIGAAGKDIAEIDSANSVQSHSAKLNFKVPNSMPTIGNTDAHGTCSFTSGSKVLTIRFYDSDNAGGYDTASTADLQLDIGLSGETGKSMADKIAAACTSKFTGYTISTPTNANPSLFSVTAAPGALNWTINYTVAGDTITKAELLATTEKNDVTAIFNGLINVDGSSEAGISALSINRVIGLIVSNSDGSGSASAEGTAALIHGIVSSSITLPPTSEEIQAALAASSGNNARYDHSGTTGWAWLGHVLWANTAETLTSNRNNHLGK